MLQYFLSLHESKHYQGKTDVASMFSIQTLKRNVPKRDTVCQPSRDHIERLGEIDVYISMFPNRSIWNVRIQFLYARL